MRLTKLFTYFFNSEKAGGIILLICTIISLCISNSYLAEEYTALWHLDLLGRPLEFWINEVIMTIFFLLVGLEIEREVYIGELSNLKNALLPILAAVGGMVVPALIHFALNYGTPTQNGFGIPMATDIAFSLAILSLLGKRVPASLKIFLTALAIIDDIGAILTIAIFYSDNISFSFLAGGVLVFGMMITLNRLRMHIVWIYLLLGAVLWYCLYRTGIHPTITGILLAFAIPFGSGDKHSPSYPLQHKLHQIVAFVVLPLFALANTNIQIPKSFAAELGTLNSLGIIAGLVIGKPLGILLSVMGGIALGWCGLPKGVKKRDLVGIGLLAGIGFTMSIFITLLAFNDPAAIDNSKIAIILASIIAGASGYLTLRLTLKKPLEPVR